MLRRLIYILSGEGYYNCLGWVNLMIRYVSELAVEGTILLSPSLLASDDMTGSHYNTDDI
jgi:hypothetical protein